MLDKSKLPGNLWLRMTWIPEEGSGPEERPIVLVSDRAHAPAVLLILPLAVTLAGGRYAGGGQSGYYEVREDGSLGDFLGRRIPPVLRDMRRAKS